jgi:hypothetical protein
MKDHACPSNVGGVKNRICVTVCSRTSAIDDLRNPVSRPGTAISLQETHQSLAPFFEPSCARSSGES